MTLLNLVNEDEACTCSVCGLIEEYTPKIVGVDTVPELKDILNELTEKAICLGHEEGFDKGFNVGYKASLQDDIEIKQSILEDIDSGECCCDCDEEDYS